VEGDKNMNIGIVADKSDDDNDKNDINGIDTPRVKLLTKVSVYADKRVLDIQNKLLNLDSENSK